MRLGVLALQGDFAAHAKAFARAGAPVVEVRTPEALAEVDALAIPGGESTTMLKFLDREGLWDPLLAFAARGGAFLGTCAGAILLAKSVTNPEQRSLGVVDISVRRNAYGRQIDSFIASGPAPALGPELLEMVFIRAPQIENVGPAATAVVEYLGKPVLVEQGRHLVATFHPELTSDDRIHRRFLANLTK